MVVVCTSEAGVADTRRQGIVHSFRTAHGPSSCWRCVYAVASVWGDPNAARHLLPLSVLPFFEATRTEQHRPQETLPK